MEYPSASTTHYQFPFPKKASPERGDSPRGGEMSRRDREDRQQAVVGFPQHILKKKVYELAKI